MKAHLRTYILRMCVMFSAYMALLFLINWMDLTALPDWQRLALAASPVLPAALTIPIMLALVRTMDEVWQRIFNEAALIAAGIVGLGTFTLGFVEGVMPLPDGLLIWVWPAMIMVHGIALPFVQRRYA